MIGYTTQSQGNAPGKSSNIAYSTVEIQASESSQSHLSKFQRGIVEFALPILLSTAVINFSNQQICLGSMLHRDFANLNPAHGNSLMFTLSRYYGRSLKSYISELSVYKDAINLLFEEHRII